MNISKYFPKPKTHASITWTVNNIASRSFESFGVGDWRVSSWLCFLPDLSRKSRNNKEYVQKWYNKQLIHSYVASSSTSGHLFHWIFCYFRTPFFGLAYYLWWFLIDIYNVTYRSLTTWTSSRTWRLHQYSKQNWFLSSKRWFIFCVFL